MRKRYKREEVPPRLAVFDTEGTTIENHPEGPCALLYFWDFLVLDGTPNDVSRETVADVCHHVSGRDTQSLYSHLNDALRMARSEGFRWVIGVHNFTYDYGYLRAWAIGLENSGYTVAVSAKSSTCLLTLSVSAGKTKLLTFFDTLALFGCSLRTLGANLGFEKLHLDYDAIRTPDTPLSASELAYNYRDTEVLMVGVCQSLLTRPSVALDDLGTSVLTKTSIVRKGDREASTIGALPLSCPPRRNRRQHAKRTVYDQDRYITGLHQFDTMEDMQEWSSYGSTLTTDVKGFFAGGVNVSNANHIGEVMHNVVSFDLKSAYPAIMLSYRIPDKPFKVPESELASYAPLLTPGMPDPVDVLTLKCGFWHGTVRFHGVRMRQDWRCHVGDSTITQSMVIQNSRDSRGIRFEDGYMTCATELVMKLANSEFYEMCLQYEWDSAELERLTVYRGIRRPTYYSILRTVFHYHEKCVAKAVSKAFKNGVALANQKVNNWVDAGYVTFDEGEALKSGQVDEAWVNAFVMSHKGNLNSLYGIQVTDPMKDEYTIGLNGYLVGEHSDFESYEKSTVNSLMWREAGVCIAIFNRYKIAYMARLQVEAGADVLYIDTDSIKSVGLSADELTVLYKPLHDRIQACTHELVSDTFADVNARLDAYERTTGQCVVRPEMPAGDDFESLGKLDYEGTYEKFVTYGHKKYAYYDKRWNFKCSGYALGVLHAFGAQLERDGLGDLVPAIVLGYDTRYDSSTKIATVQAGIDSTCTRVIVGDYEGLTCPGYAILDSGKVMNNLESTMNAQRFEAACRNNPMICELNGLDVRRDGDTFTFGKRGCVRMDWAGWDMDYSNQEAISL